MYQLTVTQEEVYDCIPCMYSGRDIFSTGCFRPVEFDLHIENGQRWIYEIISRSRQIYDKVYL
jgi:hypothetical protein